MEWTLLRGLARGLHMAGSFLSFGTMFLGATLLAGKTLPGLRALAGAGLALALAAGAAWFALQTADFASAQNFADVVAAAPLVATATRFGALLLGRCAVLALATLCFAAGRSRIAAVLALGAVIAESWLGHGGAMEGPVGTALLLASILHLAAGAAWLGALPALYLAVRHLPEAEAARVARRFSPLGLACVAALAATSGLQFWFLIRWPASLFSTGYGRVALLKILLLAGLVGLAALNRQRFTPGLPAAKSWLLRSIALETALGLLVLLAAGLILQLAPPAMATMAP